MLHKSIVWQFFMAFAALGLWTGIAEARSVALLVGVGDYQDQQLDILGVDQDLKKAKEIMLRLGVSERDITQLYNEQATLDAVVLRMRQFVDELQPEDIFYLYLSTHGLQLDDQNGDEMDGRDEAMALADFSIGKAGEDVEVSGALLDDQLAEMLAALPNHRKVIIADTCHSGTISKSLSDDIGEAITRVGKFIQMPSWLRSESTTTSANSLDELSQPGVLLLSAAADGELADIDESGSVFTRALFNAQMAAEQDNAWCWFQRARAQVRDETGGVQWPQFDGDFAPAIRPLGGSSSAMRGVSLLYKCTAEDRFLTKIQQQSDRSSLAAISAEPGWITAVSVTAAHSELQLRPQSSRWHHGEYRETRMGRLRAVDHADSAAWVVWTADGVELPRHGGDFNVFWKGLQGLPDQQWASHLLQGVDLNVR